MCAENKLRKQKIYIKMRTRAKKIELQKTGIFININSNFLKFATHIHIYTKQSYVIYAYGG